jgi:hypothetical protein
MIEDIINSLLRYQQDVMCAEGNTLEQEEALDDQIKYMKQQLEYFKELTDD